MAKKPRVNKTQAVRDYLRAHPKAMSSEIAAALSKQGTKISPGHVANIKSKAQAKRRARRARAKSAAATAAGPALPAQAAPATKSSDTLTLRHVKTVAQMVKTIGGFDRLKELLEVIREVGGLKKFRDLLEAMAATETDVVKF